MSSKYHNYSMKFHGDKIFTYFNYRTETENVTVKNATKCLSLYTPSLRVCAEQYLRYAPHLSRVAPHQIYHVFRGLYFSPNRKGKNLSGETLLGENFPLYGNIQHHYALSQQSYKLCVPAYLAASHFAISIYALHH